MINKIAVIAVLLILIIVPCVQADAAPPPKPNNDEYLSIDVEIKSPEAKIGEEFLFDIEFTNLTSKEMYLYALYSSTFSDIYFDKEHITDMHMYTLKAYESVTFEIETELKDTVDWYMVDNKFYFDFDIELEFYVYRSGEYYERFKIDEPIEIINLYDGSEYIEYEWLDDRDTVYYLNTHMEDNIESAKQTTNNEGSVLYSLKYRNISGIEIEGLGSGEEIIRKSEFYISEPSEDIDKRVTSSYRWMFKIEGEYYCAEATREYNQQYLNVPNVDIIIQPIFIINDRSDKYTYKVEVINNGETSIDNFMIYISDTDYTRFDDFHIMQKGVVGIDHNFVTLVSLEDITNFNYFVIGYYIDGDIYYWESYETIILFPIIEYLHIEDFKSKNTFGYCFDYEDYLEFCEEKENKNKQIDAANVIEISEPTIIPAVSDENITVVSEKNRSDIWIITVIFIVILFVAVVLAAISIINIIKGKKGSESEEKKGSA